MSKTTSKEKYRKCKSDNEKQEHILKECRGIHTDEQIKVKTPDIFREDITRGRANIKKIVNTINKLEE